MSEEDTAPRAIITPGDEEDPEEVSGEPVDEAEVLGEFAWLADPAAHQEDIDGATLTDPVDVAGIDGGTLAAPAARQDGDA